LKRLFFIGFLLLVSPALAQDFLSAQFHEWDLARLKAFRQSTPSNQDLNFDSALVELALFDRLDESLKIHEARQSLRTLGAFCEQTQDRTPRVLALCLMVLSEQWENETSWGHWGLSYRISETLKQYLDNPLAPPERWYVEGRVFARLAPSSGQDYRRAVVALSFLERALPKLWGASALLTEVHCYQGRFEAYEASLERVVAKTHSPDRLIKLSQCSQKGFRRAIKDGLGWGLSLGVQADPTQGWRGSVGWHDDRVNDTKLGVGVVGSVSTRGTAGAGFRFSHPEWYPPYGLGAKIGIENVENPFYGSGGATQLSDETRLSSVHLNFALSIDIELPYHFYANVGLRWHRWNPSSFGSGASSAELLSLFQGRSLSGPTLSLGWDTRDSAVDPRHGTQILMQGYFPSGFLGSDIQAESWALIFQKVLAPIHPHTLVLEASHEWLRGESHYGILPRLASEKRRLSAIRIERFMDRNALALSAEARIRVWPSLTVGGFAHGAKLSSVWSDLFQQNLLVGGGAFVEWRAYRRLTPRLRLETGVFQSEWVLQLLGEMAEF